MSHRPGWFPSLIISGTVALGFGVAWGLLVGGLVNMMPSILGGELAYERFFFLVDGTPVVARHDVAHWDKVSFRDLQGNSVSEAAARRQARSVFLSGAKQPTGPWRKLSWSSRIRSFHDAETPGSYWHFVHDGRRAGSGYFVGYDSATRARIGFIGRSGFLDQVPSLPQRFEVDGPSMEGNRVFASYQYHQPGYEPGMFPGSLLPDQIAPWLVYMVADDRLYEVNVKDRSVRVVLEQTPTPIVTIGLNYPNSDSFIGPTPTQLVVRTADQVLVYNHKLELVRTLPIPAEVQSEFFLAFYEFADGRAVFHVQKSIDMVSYKSHQSLYWMNRKGVLERTAEFELQMPGEGDWMVVLVLPAALLAGLLAVSYAWSEVGMEGIDGFSSAFGVVLRQLWPELVVVLLLSSVLAWICYRRQARFAVPGKERITWAVFVLLFGLPGFVGYFFHRRWPVLDKCPTCAKHVPADRDACSACGTTFPEPLKKGIEVFA